MSYIYHKNNDVFGGDTIKNINYYIPEYYEYLTGKKLFPGKTIKCFNPSHNDSHPSLKFYEKNTPHFWCFGCRKFYDIYDMASFIAGKSRIDVESDISHLDSSFSSDRFLSDQFSVLAILRRIEEICTLQLLYSKSDIEYFIRKNLSKNDLIPFGIGYINSEEKLFKELFSEFNSEVIEYTFKLFDLFKMLKSGNILIPLKVNGVTKSFAVRQFANGPKYLNTKNSSFFKKNRYVYLLEKTKNIKRIFITEGYFDAIKLNVAGVPAVSVMGTDISPYQISVIHSSGIDEVVLCLDPDPAGLKSTIDFLDDNLNVIDNKRFKILHGLGKDIDEIISDNPDIINEIDDHIFHWYEIYAAFKLVYCENLLNPEKEMIRKLALTPYSDIPAVSEILSKVWKSLYNRDYSPDKFQKALLIEKQNILLNEKEKIKYELKYFTDCLLKIDEEEKLLLDNNW